MRTAFLRCKGRGDHHDKPIAPLAFRRRAFLASGTIRLSARCDSLMGRSAIQRGPRRRNRHLPRSAAIATKERVAAGQSSGDGRRGPSGGSSQSGAGLCRSDAGPAIAAVTVPGGRPEGCGGGENTAEGLGEGNRCVCGPFARQGVCAPGCRRHRSPAHSAPCRTAVLGSCAGLPAGSGRSAKLWTPG